MTTRVIKTFDEDGYTMVPRSAIDNPRVSPGALGLLIRLLTDGEKYDSIRALAEDYGETNLDDVDEAAQELAVEGYLRFGEDTEVWDVAFGWETS